MKRGDVVLLDTNVFVEAHRVECLDALGKEFKIVTVDKVVEEIHTGEHLRDPKVNIDRKHLDSLLSEVVEMDEDDVLDWMEEHNGLQGTHDGERHLIALGLELIGQGNDVWFLSSPDIGAMRVMYNLGWRDRLISLEKMLDVLSCNPKQPLRDNYTERFHSQIITGFLLG